MNALEKVGLASIVEIMVESRLSWFGHVQRSPLEAPITRVYQIQVNPISKGFKDSYGALWIKPMYSTHHGIKVQLLLDT
ncbi:hypothetical protein Lal_00019116 [Lupinus albus]|nr:hypothetical protein Lal_00019116 [Lupinus albus]